MSEVTTAPSLWIRWPGRAATDARVAVTITEPGLPFPVVVYFVRVFDDERPEAIAVINVGLEVGHRFDVSGNPREAHPIGDRLPRPLDLQAVQHVADRARQYVEYARAAVEFKHGGASPGARRQAGRRRELTDDFLATVAKQYTDWSEQTGRAVTEIAKAHGVQRSTASRWVAAARSRSFLPAKGDES